MIIKAAKHGLKNSMNGVVDNLLMAQTIPIGTSYSEILVDWEALSKNIPKPPSKNVPNALEIFNDTWFSSLSLVYSNREEKKQKRRCDYFEREDAFHSKSIPFSAATSSTNFETESNPKRSKLSIDIMSFNK